MKSMIKAIYPLLRGEIRAFLLGIALSLIVLVMGVSLLALSGWFITAAAAAGMLGMGTVFNVFAPSAMVRFLALGRTAARYGERLTTHDATLRALANLRVRLLGGVMNIPYRQLERLRASVFLNRVTADIDSLDGMALRLVLPGSSGLVVIVLTGLAVAMLVHPSIGMIIFLGYAVGPTMIFLVGHRLADRPSRRLESGMQALRSRVVDLIAVREELITFGQVQKAKVSILKAAKYQSQGQAAVDQIERQTGYWLELAGWIVVSLAFGIGASLAQAGDITAAQAAIGIFAALALSETVAPVRRALSEIGRIRSAAKRIAPLVDPIKPVTQPIDTDFNDKPLVTRAIETTRGADKHVLFAPLSFTVEAGQTVALTGRSGCGKSTVLLMAAGQIKPSGGHLIIGDTPLHLFDTDALTQQIAMVPQRHALVAGTIAQNLRLADPAASDEDLWAALEATQLAPTLRAKNGLDTNLGFRGTGLSGGEARRLVLARAILRDPRVLLLDEPTEGLDAPLATSVLKGIRNALPRAAILIAAHRQEEVTFADRIVVLDAPQVNSPDNTHFQYKF